MSRKISQWLRVLALVVVLLTCTATPIFAQGPSYVIEVVQVDTSHFPQISVWVSVTDAAGNPVTSLDGSTFTLLENGQPVTITDVSQSGDQEAGAVNVILAIDRSGSMNEVGKMDAAKAAATAFVDLMRPQDATGVIAFNTQVEVIQPLTSDANALRAAIASIEAFDDTAMYDGLAASTEMLSSVDGRRAVILLSDGLDNSSQHNADDILSTIEGAELSVYAIGLGNPSAGTGSWAGIDEAALRAIAERSRGEYTYTPDAQRLSELYGRLSAQLQNEYRLNYVTSNTLRDGLGRGIEVQIAEVGSVQTGYNPGGVIPETSEALAWPVFGAVLLALVALLALPGLLKRFGETNPVRAPNGKSRVKLTGNQVGGKPVGYQPQAITKSEAVKPQAIGKTKTAGKSRVRLQGKG